MDLKIGVKGLQMSRRTFLGGTALCLSGTALSAAKANGAIKVAELRGTLDATEFGVIPDSGRDQSVLLQDAINRAVERGRALFLPAGNYPVANLRLPTGAMIVGVPGRTRLAYMGGGGNMVVSEGASYVGLTGLTFDGGNKIIGDYTEGLLHFIGARDLSLSNCEINGSSRSGLLLDRCSGRVDSCTVTGAAEAGIRSNEAAGLSITDNVVSDCANGGILVYRWTDGEDNTIVSGNRVERIAARYGGTGQFGNGINVFRANGVMISNNKVNDCAFSAIRSNSGSNVQIIGNSCLRSGETAIYSEFGFQGAVIANNLVDGATMGISITNSNEGGRLAVCSGNLVRNLTTIGPYEPEVAGFGIGIAVEADTTVIGNVIEGAPRFGMILGWGPYLDNVIVSNNVIRDAGTGMGVTVVEGAGPATITNNILQRVHNGGIIGFRWTDRTTGELDGTTDWEHLDVRDNRVVAL